jgi:hypothetical protein
LNLTSRYFEHYGAVALCEDTPVEIAFLYFDDCPNWTTASDRLGEAMRLRGLDPATIRFQLVTSDDEAQAAQFRGSPTVLLNGRDPFVDPSASAEFGLTCRLYDGDVAPSLSELCRALDEAQGA